ncbi:sulfurtransferase complex subunit TusB [Microbulbifer sp. SH-1]|uniref:sulfurtransferase complex subunit TusB n=1 Tax=Microbulbifer sp. SH-1 TaxID=2681547 RepID=UPI0014083CA5|nr:sulfurtransferase complex subunit TusB [Microbulbifer sp. SH-1]QIL89112.1 sulfurtransferase complex subunit TusB [Microbulbifer sp. SH-1]
MTLHIVNQSPYAGSALSDCLNALHPGDAVVLIEDGVYAVNDPRLSASADNSFCLGADAIARGVTVPESIETIDEARWVALCTEHNPIVSWFR